jgi:hypothetical protein
MGENRSRVGAQVVRDRVDAIAVVNDGDESDLGVDRAAEGDGEAADELRADPAAAAIRRERFPNRIAGPGPANGLKL